MYIGDPIPDPPSGWLQYLYGNWALITFDMLAVTRDDTAAEATARDWALALSATDWWKVDDIAPMDTLADAELSDAARFRQVILESDRQGEVGEARLVLAVDDLGEQPCRCGLAASTRARKEICMGEPALLEGLLKGGRHMLLSDYLGESTGSPFSG